MRDGGAVSVQVEEVVTPTTRARAPEIAAATTLREKVETLWTVQGFDPGVRRQSLLAKLGQIEEAYHAS
jgi:hypothetical protein